MSTILKQMIQEWGQLQTKLTQIGFYELDQALQAKHLCSCCQYMTCELLPRYPNGNKEEQ